MRTKITILLLLFVFSTSSPAHASFYDLVVGGTIKGLAKIFVKTSNLKKLKTKYIKMISTMREDKFEKYYTKFFNVYTQLPVDLKQKFVFTEKTSKTEVIDKIEKVNKKDLMTIINKVPCEFIVKQTKVHTTPPKDQLPENMQVNETFLWRRIIQKI